MKYQSLFSDKRKKNIINLLSIELAKRVVTAVSIPVTKCLALWVKFSADNILKYLSYFSQKTDFDISCEIETICMKCPAFWEKYHQFDI